MTKRTRRNHNPAFKVNVDLAAVRAIGSGSMNKEATSAVDLEALHAKIGKLALENDFLPGAPGKAGPLNAKRWLTGSTT